MDANILVNNNYNVITNYYTFNKTILVTSQRNY